MIARRLATTAGAVAFCCVMGAIGLTTGWYFSKGPPAIVINIHETDGVAVRGGWLELDVTLLRTKICDARVERWLWRETPGGRTWVPMPAVASPPTPLDVETHYRVWLPVPGNIPAGEWHYMSRTHDECQPPWSLASEVVRESADVPVTILDPPQSAPAQVVIPPGPITVLPLPPMK